MFDSKDELIRYLDTQGWSEKRHCEFKAGMPWNSLKYTLTKAALAMANLAGGGYIIIGVSEGKDDGDGAEPTGLTEQDGATYTLDDVSEFFNAYADPHVDIDVAQFEHSGRFLIVIQVYEFSQTPVICKKDSEKTRRGVIYCRSHKKPESVAVPSSAEMEEIIDLAVDKGMQRQRRRIQSYGTSIDGRLSGGEREPASQQAEAAMKTLTQRGHWEIKLTPTAYPETLHSLSDLQAALRECQVQLRGWYYPHIALRHGEMYNLNKCVEAWLRWYTHVDVLRFYEHGQFVHHIGMVEDWDDGKTSAMLWNGSADLPAAPAEPFLEPVMALYTLTEIHLFASRIANRGILGDELEIDITLHKQDSRVLKATERPHLFFEGATSRASHISLGPRRTTPAELRAGHEDMAVATGLKLFDVYNFSAEDLEKTMRGWQAGLYGRRP